ncbi:MAG: ATP-binding protein [Campylobacterota bacterium]|nr:ATP-binding protein [Campylobacterota bacterium]
MGFFNLNSGDDIIFEKNEKILELKINIVIVMLFLTSAVLILFSIIRVLNGDTIPALADLLGAFLCFALNIILKKNKKYYNIISITFISIVTLVVTIALFASGHELVRAMWYFAILTLAYYLRDRNEGTKWLVLFVSLLIISFILNQNSNIVEYITMIGSLLVVSLVLYFYDKIKISETEDLAEQKDILEKMVQERTQELKELNENLQLEVQKELANNTLKDKMMVQHSKMAMMGEMIANIAHQFRQPLSAINATAGGLKVEMEMGLIDEHETKSRLDNIEKYVDHLSSTIGDFRDFFKEDKEKTLINLSKTIDKNLFIIESTLLKNDIKTVKNYDETIKVKLLQNELAQSVLNILNNAKDALVDSVEKDEGRFVFIDISMDQNIPVISIKDNAGGIPEQIITKIFDDKFTTKGDKDGTGIGLYMTKSMIEDHIKGKVVVTNEEFEYQGVHQKGACFKIILANSEVHGS